MIPISRRRKRMKKPPLAATVGLLAVLAVVSCSESTTQSVPVSTVVITVPQNEIRVGATIQATALTLDAYGSVLPNRPVQWQTSDAAIASVSSDGLIKGESPGQATITASSEGKTANITLLITLVPVTEVTFDPPSLNLVVGQTGRFQVITKDSTGKVVTGRQITWSVNNPSLHPFRLMVSSPVRTLAERQSAPTLTGGSLAPRLCS